MHRRLSAIAATIGLTLAMTAALPAFAETPAPGPPGPVDGKGQKSSTPSPLPNQGADDPSSKLEYPPVPDKMLDLANAITELTAGQPQFAVPEISMDRTTLIIHAHGEPSTALNAVIARYPDVRVQIRQTPYAPDELQRIAEEIRTNRSDVATAYMKSDGSGIHVILKETPAKSRLQSEQSIESAVPNVPVTFEVGNIESTVSRATDDVYHIGGSKIANRTRGGGCSSGFSVYNLNTQKEGMMFAAHCGEVGDEWVATDSNYYYHWGHTTYRNAAYDGAIITMGFSQPAVWTGPHTTTNSLAMIYGGQAPAIGLELCTSGAYSGEVCGNRITELNVPVDYGFGDLRDVTAFRTDQRNNVPAVGNGDSGGPAFIVPASGERRAVGIISGITGGGSTCTGTPAEPPYRLCSKTVLYGGVFDIQRSSGSWIVMYPGA